MEGKKEKRTEWKRKEAGRNAEQTEKAGSTGWVKEHGRRKLRLRDDGPKASAVCYTSWAGVLCMDLGLWRHTAGTQYDSPWEVQLYTCLMTQSSSVNEDKSVPACYQG